MKSEGESSLLRTILNLGVLGVKAASSIVAAPYSPAQQTCRSLLCKVTQRLAVPPDTSSSPTAGSDSCLCVLCMVTACQVSFHLGSAASGEQRRWPRPPQPWSLLPGPDSDFWAWEAASEAPGVNSLPCSALNRRC